MAGRSAHLWHHARRAARSRRKGALTMARSVLVQHGQGQAGDAGFGSPTQRRAAALSAPAPQRESLTLKPPGPGSLVVRNSMRCRLRHAGIADGARGLSL